MRITKRSFSTVVFPPRHSLRKRGSALGLSKTFEKIPTTKVRLIFEASKFRRSIHCTVHPIANALLIRQNARHDRKVAKNPKNYESQPNRPRTPRIVAHRAHSASESVGNPCPRMRNSQSNRQTNSRLRHSIPQILYYGEFYQFNLSSCIRQQNSLTAQFVSFSLSNLANIFYPPPNFYNN